MENKLKYFFLVIVISAIIYCEFLADYVVLYSCSWPKITKKNKDENILNAMILADTHILGPIRGHWLDKLYREWHMHRAFQAAITLLRPEVVFILGDLFDEGDLIDHKQFEEHVTRFKRHFHTNAYTPIISAVGNHDIGFHYRLHPYFAERFENNFNNTGVRLYSLKSIHFVLVNSMAMENDGCYFCENAIKDLEFISDKLKCLRSPACTKNKNLLKEHGTYSFPIIMQHFPTYRASDKLCLEHDAPKLEKFRENWEVLSINSTDMLGNLLKPRVAFAGHSHHYCLSKNRWNVEEYTVASFNWRNKINPSFLLSQFSPTNYAVKKCHMLEQEMVYNVYLAAVISCSVILSSLLYLKLRKRSFLSYKRHQQ